MILFLFILGLQLSSFYQGYCSQIRACDEFQISSPLIRDRINVAIRWHIGNLKNTHVGAHWSVPRQPYIGAPILQYLAVILCYIVIQYYALRLVTKTSY